jgi:hypothetical protein
MGRSRAGLTTKIRAGRCARLAVQRLSSIPPATWSKVPSAKLKHFRAVATRFEKHSKNYLALVKLASAKTWMRLMSR